MSTAGPIIMVPAPDVPLPLAGVRPYPHEGGCPRCRELRVCNYCGCSIVGDSGRCTNGRCSMCHAGICGSGDAHGFGRDAWRFHYMARYPRVLADPLGAP